MLPYPGRLWDHAQTCRWDSARVREHTHTCARTPRRERAQANKDRQHPLESESGYGKPTKPAVPSSRLITVLRSVEGRRRQIRGWVGGMGWRWGRDQPPAQPAGRPSSPSRPARGMDHGPDSRADARGQMVARAGVPYKERLRLRRRLLLSQTVLPPPPPQNALFPDT